VKNSGLGADSIEGGDGRDMVYYGSRSAPVTVTLADRIANDGELGEGDNVETDVEDVIGGLGNDTLVGSAGSNLLSGGADRDFLDASDGRTFDTVDCGGGPDEALVYYLLRRPSGLPREDDVFDCEKVSRVLIPLLRSLEA
jgi:Ca2+-binding RTX toxin-like protein